MINENSENLIVTFIKDQPISFLAFIYLILFGVSFYYNWSDFYINVLIASYIGILIIYSLWRSYDMIISDNIHKLVTSILKTLNILFLGIFIFIPLSVIFANIFGPLNELRGIEIYIVPVVFIFTVFIFTILFIFLVLFTGMFFESRIESYIFGWSNWDEDLVDEIKKDSIVEDIEYNEDGIYIYTNVDDVSIKDYTSYFDEKLVKYNIKIKNL